MDTNGQTATLGPETGESTVTQSTESTGQGPVETQASQGEPDNAGDSQELSESGKDNGTEPRSRNFRSKNQTIFELRRSIRERDSQLAEFKQRMDAFEQKFQPRQERKPSRTFWEAPEDVLNESLRGELSAMEERLAQRWSQTQTRNQETSEWKQETSEAAKFIHSQKDLTEEDVLEITELVREHPSMEKLRPMERAEYAVYLYNKNKGVADKTPMKNKAFAPSGSASTGKPRVYTEAELESEVKKFGDPKNWDADTRKKYDVLERDIRQAYRDGRVKK